MNMALHWIVLGVLFLLSFFFSASETALFSLSKLDKRKLKEQYPHVSKWIFEQLQAPRKTLGTVLIGNLAVNSLRRRPSPSLSSRFSGMPGLA